VKGYRGGMAGSLCPGCIMCVKGVVLGGMCDLVAGQRLLVSGECMPDLEPS